MNKNKFLFFVFSFMTLTYQVSACSCYGPDKFINSISDFTAEVEVLTLDSIRFIQDNRIATYPITILLVQKTLKGKTNSDTLILLKDYGFECFHSVPYREKGQRYILTGNFEEKRIISGEDTLLKSIYYLDLCKENILILRNGKVLGNITRNKKTRIEKQQKIIAHISKSASYWYYNKRVRRDKSEKLLQVMSERKFYRILNKKHSFS